MFCCSVPGTLEAHFVLATLAERTESVAGSQTAAARADTAAARVRPSGLVSWGTGIAGKSF